jgi:hypothetical protein
MIYMFLFGTGKIIFGQTGTGIAFVAAGLVLGAGIYGDLSRRGWKVVSG